MRKRSQEEIEVIKEEQEITRITKDCGLAAVEGAKEVASLVEDDINELFKDDIINNYIKWLTSYPKRWIVISNPDSPFDIDSLELLFQIWEKLVIQGFQCERSHNKLKIVWGF